MSRTISSKYLPAILHTVEQNKLEGVLVANFNARHSVQLFFRQGQFVHICSEQPDQAAEELLHEVLNGTAFELYWQPLQIRLGQTNVNAETRQALQDVLPILIQGGNFLATTEALAEDFFPAPHYEPGVKPVVEPVAIEILPPSVPVTAPKAKTETLVTTPRFYETNLLLPPGQRQDQLEGLLGAVSFKEQLASLSQAHFTGYAYYHPAAQPSAWGLVLFWQGRVTDVIYSQDNQTPRQNGSMAHQSLQKLVGVPQIYRVDERVLKAYRGLVTCKQPQTNIAATKANFNNLLAAFQQAGRDGVIILYADKLKLHYFFLLENGTNVGLFTPESKSGRLAPLTAPLVLPGSDPASHFTVLLASKIGSTELPASPDSSATPPQLQPAEAELEVVDWSGMLQPLTQSQQPQVKLGPSVVAKNSATKETPSYQPDTANPFDF